VTTLCALTILKQVSPSLYNGLSPTWIQQITKCST